MNADSVHVELTVNGRPRAVDIAAGRTLLDMLRWELDLTGSKECCAEGECGACTVHLDGEPVNACLVLAAETNGADVRTIEGLGAGDRLSRLQDAFLDAGAVQCGFCIPGMVMAADALLHENPHPSEEDVREGLSGNLCRCAGYTRICRAVLSVADGQADHGRRVEP